MRLGPGKRFPKAMHYIYSIYCSLFRLPTIPLLFVLSLRNIISADVRWEKYDLICRMVGSFYMKDLLFFYVWNDFCKYSENIAKRTFVVFVYWSDALYQSVPFEVSELAPKQFCRFLYIFLFFMRFLLGSRIAALHQPNELKWLTAAARLPDIYIHIHLQELTRSLRWRRGVDVGVALEHGA